MRVMRRLICLLRGHRPTEQPWPRAWTGTPYDETTTAVMLRLGLTRFMRCERCGATRWIAEEAF